MTATARAAYVHTDGSADLSAEARRAKVEASGVKADARSATDLTRQKFGASLTALTTGATRACAGAAMAGGVAGVAGGLLLSVVSGNAAPLAIVPVLAVVGAGAGAVGGLGVGGGLAFAESSSRLRNAAGLTIGAAGRGSRGHRRSMADALEPGRPRRTQSSDWRGRRRTCDRRNYGSRVRARPPP